MALVAGIDGCPEGWLVVQRGAELDGVTAWVARDAADLRRQTSRCAIVAIDIPIGVPDGGARACDVEARRLIRAPRASGVFPCPVRPALPARSYPEAATLSRAADGRSLSQRAFAILHRIRDVDETLRADPDWRARVREGHPELCFYFWNGERPMPHAKRTSEGFEDRRRLVEGHFGAVYDTVRNQIPRRAATDDDILDAFAALWTAERVAAGQARMVPEAPAFDSLGLPMTMVA